METPSSSPPGTKVVIVAVALIAAVGSLILLDRGERTDPIQEKAENLRSEIQELQGRVDECLARRGSLEARFQQAVDRTEALGDRVRELESLDPEGVPAERYAEYLEVFDEYNESIPEWERLGEALREEGERCQRLADAHNQRLERLRELMVEAFAPVPPSE
jgi:chaperonin cofactor prefoldin